MAEEKGVWRTVRGRRVFIREGEDLASAMARSGKFKREDIREGRRETSVNDKLNKADKTTSKRQSEILRNKAIKRNSLFFLKGKQDEKNEINPTAYIEGGANTRVKRNWNRYSEEQRREERENVLRQKIQDYKNKKGNSRTTTQVNKEYEELSKKMQADDYYYKPEDDRKLKSLRSEYDSLVAKGQEDVNFKNDYDMNEKQAYDSKAYAKLLSKSYNADSEYEDKTTPKYIQDIEAGRYGNMTDEDAIKNWLDGGADIVYIQDAENLLKQWGVPIRNDDAFETYKEELTKQLLPIYKNDKLKANTRTSKSDEEYELYKKAKVNPDSIDPMTENSTDWETLNEKYASRYNEEIKSKIRKKAITVEQEGELENTERMINDIKNQKIDRINTKAEMEFNKEAQRILQKPTVADVRKELRSMNNWSDTVQYGDVVITKTGHTGYHIRNVNDEDDPMTDYFAGVYGVKEKQVLNMLQDRGFVEKAEVKEKVNNFNKRKGKINKEPTKRDLAGKIVDNQIRRGTVKKENREKQIQYRLRNMTKEELEKASSFYN